MSDVEFSDIELTAGFHAPVSYIYEAFTNQGQISGYTQAPATFEAKEGGKVTFFGGSVQGQVLALSPNEIKMHWRFKEWEEGVNSTVTIKLDAVDSTSTKLTLTQTHIPHADRYGNHGVVEKVRQGWSQFFFDRIQRIMGYGKLDV